MWTHYLKIAWRTVLRQKGYAAINLLGLTVGLTSFLLILLFVQHELSYDRFFTKADQIYRIVQVKPGQGYLGSDRFASTAAPLAAALVAEFSEVVDATTVDRCEAFLNRGDDGYLEEGLFADASFFKVFSFPLLRGQRETVLTDAHGIVLTASLARRIFGDADPVGQILLCDRQAPCTVTGVVADPPPTSSLQFSFVVSIQSQSMYAERIAEHDWSNDSGTPTRSSPTRPRRPISRPGCRPSSAATTTPGRRRFQRRSAFATSWNP